MEIVVYNISGSINYVIRNVVEFLIDTDNDQLFIMTVDKINDSVKRFIISIDDDHHNFKVI